MPPSGPVRTLHHGPEKVLGAAQAVRTAHGLRSSPAAPKRSAKGDDACWQWSTPRTNLTRSLRMPVRPQCPASMGECCARRLFAAWARCWTCRHRGCVCRQRKSCPWARPFHSRCKGWIACWPSRAASCGLGGAGSSSVRSGFGLSACRKQRSRPCEAWPGHRATTKRSGLISPRRGVRDNERYLEHGRLACRESVNPDGVGSVH